MVFPQHVLLHVATQFNGKDIYERGVAFESRRKLSLYGMQVSLHAYYGALM